MEPFNFEVNQGGWIRQCIVKPSGKVNQDGTHQFYSVKVNDRFLGHLFYEKGEWKDMEGRQSELINQIGKIIRTYIQ